MILVLESVGAASFVAVGMFFTLSGGAVFLYCSGAFASDVAPFFTSSQRFCMTTVCKGAGHPTISIVRCPPPDEISRGHLTLNNVG